MRTRLVIATVLLALVAPSLAHAQGAPPSPLARALADRYPEHEIVPRSCLATRGERLVVGEGRLCLMDERTGLPRAVRRVGLGGALGGALRGTDVVFGVADHGGASTRFAGRMWRWDLSRDAYLGLGNLQEFSGVAVRAATFGVLYQLRSGWWLTDGAASGPRRVRVPEYMPWRLWITGDTTFAIDDAEDDRVAVQRVVLEDDRVRLLDHATLPGRRVHLDGGTVITAATRGRTVTVRALLLPSAEVIEVAMPEGMRAPTRATAISATRWLLVGPRAQRAVLDLAARAITTDAPEPGADLSPAMVSASSLVHVRPTAENGLYVGRFTGGWRLDARGATRVPRTHPREARARCTCDGATLVCDRGAITVPDACTEVQELDRVRDTYAETAAGRLTRESLYTNDGRFRIDRLEADHVRVTRLHDGARLWVRMFGDALFAQTDDGAFFVTDRALIDGLAIRDGRSLLESPVAPLAPRAETLFRERLVADFFAPPPPS